MSKGSMFQVPSGARNAENFRTLWRGFQKLRVVPTVSLPNISVMGFYFLSAMNTRPIRHVSFFSWAQEDFLRGSQRVPEGSRGFQRVPEGSRGFQRVPEGSRGFQRVLASVYLIFQIFFFFFWGPEGSRGPWNPLRSVPRSNKNWTEDSKKLIGCKNKKKMFLFL